MTPKASAWLAGITGIISAFIVVACIEFAGHTVYPPPADLDYTDATAMAAYVDSLPPGAFAFVLAAWTLGTFDGALAATLVARGRAAFHAWLVGGVVLAAATVNMAMIPHPFWFQVAASALIVAAAWGARMVSGLILKAQEARQRAQHVPESHSTRR